MSAGEMVMKLFEVLNTETHEVLTKFRKGSTSSFTAAKLEILLGALPGWKMEKQPVFLDLKDVPRILLGSEGLRGHKYKGKFELSYYDVSRDKAEDAYKELAKHAVKALPAKAKNKAFYVLGLKDITEEKYPGTGEKIHYNIVFTDLYYGINGYLITAPSGKTFSLGKSPSYTVMNFYEFWAWAKENTDLASEVNAALNMPDVETERKQKELAKGGDRDNVGRCQICFKNQKLTSGKKLVHHGYNRPGYGYIVGDCFGVGYQPYELGHDACDDWLKQLERMVINYKKQLKTAKAGEITKLSKSVRSKERYGKPQLVDVFPGDKDWDDLLKGHIMQIEQTLKHLAADIEVMHDRIKNWELKELPEGKKKADILKDIEQ
jgi:hypothetical protein